MESEDRVPVADDARWETMNSDDVFDDQGRHVGCRHRLCSFDEDRHFGETAHNDKDRIVVVT